MKSQKFRNKLKTHRKKSGLKQTDIGALLDCHPGQVSRHERGETMPHLKTALAYEIMLCVPVSTIFVGIYADMKREIERKLKELETELGSRDARAKDANSTAKKLVWLNQRQG